MLHPTSTTYRFLLFFICTFFILLSGVQTQAQDNDSLSRHIDSTISIRQAIKNDSARKKKVYSPRSAAIRSAILPGLGQIYNKKYWKLPIIYGALGTCAGIFIYNLKNYHDTRFAYQAKYKAGPPLLDSTDYFKIRPELQPLSLESLRFYRDQFRRDIDYSALVFMLLWGLNVVDATVDAHLKSFDVSPELTLKIKPGYSPMANTSGLSLVLSIRDNHAR
ncbi:MAG TPA: DUF5683 domain-containing protein [Chitinophagaceae bacterium]|jgi:hypothetical protein|nr:DUF5683 domain-containing protein [Chitinophagaceae bacterium]